MSCLLLGESWINHIHNTVYCEGGFRDICADNEFPTSGSTGVSWWRGIFEDVLLLLGGQGGVQRVHAKWSTGVAWKDGMCKMSESHQLSTLAADAPPPLPYGRLLD